MQVSHYPAPKNLLHKSTKRRLLQGMFVVDSRIREMINMYNHMKTTSVFNINSMSNQCNEINANWYLMNNSHVFSVLTKRGETHLLAHLEPFFLSFPGRPVDSAYFIKKFLQMSGLEHMKISCNTVSDNTSFIYKGHLESGSNIYYSTAFSGQTRHRPTTIRRFYGQAVWWTECGSSRASKQKPIDSGEQHVLFRRTSSIIFFFERLHIPYH